jgi:hypothetical protein
MGGVYIRGYTTMDSCPRATGERGVSYDGRNDRETTREPRLNPVNDTPLSIRDALARAVVPLAALAAMAALALREVDAVGGAESWYLAVLSTAVLLAAAFLAPAPAWETGLGAMLATAAVWALPPGPGRGAAVVLLLGGVLAVAAARRLASPPPGEGESDLFHLPLGITVPLALGVQVLLRGGELLFQPQASLRTLVALIALPVAGAVATTVLARRHGSLALIAAGTAVLLAPGWNVAATLGLVALAAGDLLARPEAGRVTKAVALLVLLAPIAWEPAPGLAAAAAGFALARPRVGLIAALLVALAAPFVFQGSGWLGNFPLPFLLVPGVILFAKDRLWSAVAGIALALTVPPMPDLSAMAGPLALMALCMAPHPRPLSHPLPSRRERGGRQENDAAGFLGRDGGSPLPAGWEGMGEGSGVRGIQAVWTGTLLAATALLASYPWLRPVPLGEAFGLLGITDPWKQGALILAFLLLTLLARFATPRRIPLSPAALAAGLLFVAAWIHLPATGTLLLPADTALVIDAARPRWKAGLDGQQVRALVIESSLSNGAGLANGTAIATVRLRGERARTAAWVLRAGTDTGEWAARRPDVAASSVLQSPPAWISWVAGDFFGQRYRVRWVPERASFASPLAGPFTELTVERHPGLPTEVSLAIHRVEVRH